MKFSPFNLIALILLSLMPLAPLYAQNAEEEEVDLTVTVGDDNANREEPPPVEMPDFAPMEDDDDKVQIDESLLDKNAKPDAANETYATTRRNARTMTLMIPAPRGLIVDRFGYPLAQNVINYQIVLKFGQFENEEDKEVIAYGKRCLEDAKKILGTLWGDISNEENQDALLLSHYKYRRWLPLPVSKILTPEEKKKLPEALPKGLEYLPIYRRIYPNGSSAGQIIGYVSPYGKLPKGPINHMDPLWTVMRGASGFEKHLNKPLTGRPGVWRLMFDEQGNKILDELSIKPKPGGTVVTTLNLKWQKLAESILNKRSKRGAFVVIDVLTGEILVLAAKPTFDHNTFTNITAKEFDDLAKHPNKPLVHLAYRGSYPPASTFKAVVAMGALESRLIGDKTLIYCPASIKIGNHEFKNWTKVPEGEINVYRALARSTNPFFYKLAMMKGSPSFFLSMARRLGMGSRVGLEELDDIAGTIPDEAWLNRQGRSRYYPGDPLNYSIGQGTVEATPLQVAQMMAGIADGKALPKLHIIKQLQDMDGNVIYASFREDRNSLASASYAASVVRKGLYDVVYGGTGGNARLSYTTIAGKTGTGQYAKNRHVAWFAGFLPYDRPRFAFAAFYEGAKNEGNVGGSSRAAPMVKEFFETLKSDIKNILTPVEVDVIEDGPVVPVRPRSNGSSSPDSDANVPVLPAIDEGVQPVVPAVDVEVIDIDDSSDGGNNAVEVILE